MKTLFIISAVLFCSNILFGQHSTKYIYTSDTVVVAEKSKPNYEVKRPTGYLVRLIDNAKSGRIYFNPNIVLTDANLNVVDKHGDTWLDHTFAVLSELDISVKNLPEGSYELLVSSDQGTGSMSFYR